MTWRKEGKTWEQIIKPLPLSTGSFKEYILIEKQGEIECISSSY
jgi:hypothetical protein